MGGLIKWLKKDNSSATRTRRRESAPLFFTKRSTRQPIEEAAYRQSIVRFTQFREHERINRMSVDTNELAAYHSIFDSLPDSYTGDSSSNNQSYHHKDVIYPVNYYKNTSSSDEPQFVHPCDVRLSKKITVQFQLNSTSDDSDRHYRKPRYSMPTIATNANVRRPNRIKKSFNSNAIKEEAIEEFEEAHCLYSGNMAEQSSNRSPPSSFYKQNQNPYPNQSDTSSFSGSLQSGYGKCPEKPKRLMLNNKQTRKLLTEAHFANGYENYQIRSPYYSDTSSMLSASDNFTQKSNESENYGQYRVDTKSKLHKYQNYNRKDDDIDYVLPFIEIPKYQQRQNLPNCLTSDDSILAGEIFHEDPDECVRMFDENFGRTSDISNSMNDFTHGRESHRKKGRIMITDLDKSTDSVATFSELEISKNRSQTEPPKICNRVFEFHETMRCADIICLTSEFESMGKMEAKIKTPLHFEWGTFKNTPVTVRKYVLSHEMNEKRKDFKLIAETAIIQDSDVLRQVRHPNILNLMAIAFEPFDSMALIMEPTKCSLNHHLFVKNEQLDLIEVVTIVKRIAGAVSYLQEFGICHSNISSHAILVVDNVTHVKLSSFELAVPYNALIQDEIELKSKQNIKRLPSARTKQSPRHSLSSEQKIERYKQQTNQIVQENVLESSYSVPFVRDLSTKYYPYCTDYRRKLTVFNYQPPELLSQTEQFVFPTRQSDTYALTLLLWELLNECIPFVIYDEVKLGELLSTNYPLKYLPIVEEERCQRFHDIFERGLKREPNTRIELDNMIQKLDAIETEIYRENEKNQSMNVKNQSLNQSINQSLNQNINQSLNQSLNQNLNQGINQSVNQCTKCSCMKTQNESKTSKLQSKSANNTPEKSPNKLHLSLITTPTVSSLSNTTAPTSPLNNVHRSILDFNRLLSPRRDTNNKEVERTSTLKKKKKTTPTKATKRNIRELFGDDKVAPVFGQNSDKSSGRLSNEFNRAATTFSDLTNVEEGSEDEQENRPVQKRIQQPFGPKELTTEMDTKTATANSSQFEDKDSELPPELLSRNNKILRCTWVSSDGGNGQNEESSTNLHNEQNSLSTPIKSTSIEPNDSNQKRKDANLKIIHKHVTPAKHVISMKSDCSTASVDSFNSTDDEFSVKSRIKFFRSLENQPIQFRSPNKSKVDISRRSEMSFSEAKKAIERAQRHTYPSSNPQSSDLNQQLMKEITDITADIKNCLSKNKCYMNDKKTEQTEINEVKLNHLLKSNYNHAANDSVAQLIDDLLLQQAILNENEKNQSNIEITPKRNSVRETVQMFESSIRSNNEQNSDTNFSFTNVENKLLNEMIYNPELNKKFGQFISKRNEKLQNVTDEKVEDVIRFVVPSEAENEAGAQMLASLAHGTNGMEPSTTVQNEHIDETLPVGGEHVNTTNSAVNTTNPAEASGSETENEPKTFIKRTFYHESIISGKNVDVPALKSLFANTPTVTTSYATTKRSSFTTRVTLNMRRRRSSDVGLKPSTDAVDLKSDQINSPNAADVRHSICGSPSTNLTRLNSGASTISRIPQNLSNDSNNHASAMMVNDQLQSSVCSSVLSGIFNGKQIQSIEDLYIDDDFAGINLAANMKLMTNSTDSLLDNINFDITATHIFEQNSESMMTTNTNFNANLNAIENGVDEEIIEL